jgi:hypothetical protein
MNVTDFKAALDQAVTTARAGLAAEVAGLMTTVAELNTGIDRLQGTVKDLESRLDERAPVRTGGAQ